MLIVGHSWSFLTFKPFSSPCHTLLEDLETPKQTNPIHTLSVLMKVLNLDENFGVGVALPWSISGSWNKWYYYDVISGVEQKQQQKLHLARPAWQDVQHSPKEP